MNWLFLLLSFASTAFAQPAYLGWLGIFAGFFGYALFWKGLSQFSKRSSRIFCSLIWFGLVQAVQLFWMTSTAYMGPLIFVVYGGLCLGMGGQFALLSILVPPKKPTVSTILGLAGLWTLFEWSRVYFISGFTWNPIGLALAGNPYSIAWSSLFGVYGLSFWVILVNLLGYRALFFSRSIKNLACWIFLGALPFVFGFCREKNYNSKSEKAETISALLIQTALLPEQRDPTPNKISSFVSPWDQWQRVIQFIKAASKKHDLVVLPESALPFGAFRTVYAYDKFLQIWEREFGQDALQFLPSLQTPLAEKREQSWLVSNSYWAQALANYFDCQIVVGLDYYDKEIDASYNAAFQFIPKKALPECYQKRILVPLSEYIPYAWCRSIANHFGIYDSFTAGKNSKIFSGKAPFAVSICIEEIYTALMRESRKQGASFFVNLTNDVWFPHSLLPEQHFYHGAVRAAEHGISLIRATNTGITGAVDSIGRPLKILRLKDSSACLSVDVPLVCYSTIYTHFGDGLILTLSLLSIVTAVFRVIFSKNKFIFRKSEYA
jgi:apolipoprotein N-acyltransferase